MSENLRKLIGVAVMAAIVVVGVVATSGDDSDFARTRNNAFGLPKGAGLDAQIQQPGDAENDLVIAMAAAAKCDEGHVLISTGDPVSPWRCGPLLSEMATVGIEDRVSRIELALEANAEERARIEFGQAIDALAITLDAYLDQNMNAGGNWFDYGTALAVGSHIFESGLLYGVQVEVARLAVRQIGVGFVHRLADGEETGEIAHRGTRRQNRSNEATVMNVDTRNGIVAIVGYSAVGPGN